jgi:hypothetical protein
MVLLAVIALASSAAGGTRSTICDVQEYDDQGFSPLVGQWVTVRGAVTCPPGYFLPSFTSFFVESGGCGVNVFMYDLLGTTLALGDSVEVSGEVVEYVSHNTGAGATTEIVTSPLAVVLLSSGNPEPVPTQVTCAEVNMEENEGRLLETSGTVVDLELPYSFYISDGTDVVEVYRGVPDSTSFTGVSYGDSMCVIGLLGQYDRTPPYLGSYELMPRTTRDVEWCAATAVRDASWGSIKALYR